MGGELRCHAAVEAQTYLHRQERVSWNISFKNFSSVFLQGAWLVMPQGLWIIEKSKADLSLCRAAFPHGCFHTAIHDTSQT